MDGWWVVVELFGDGVDRGRVGFQDVDKGGIMTHWLTDKGKGSHPECGFEDEIEHRHGDWARALLQAMWKAMVELVL